MCAIQDLNLWPFPRQGNALPTELTAPVDKRIQQKHDNFNVFDLFFKNGNLYDEQFTKPKTMNYTEEVYILMGGYDKDGKFLGVSHKDKHILKMIRHPQDLAVFFRVTATSQKALPNDAEIVRIAGVNPMLVFPGGIKWGMNEGPEKTFDLYGFTRGKMATVVYVDQGINLHWAGQKIDMSEQKAVKILVEGTQVIHTTYFLSEPEVVGSDL